MGKVAQNSAKYVIKAELDSAGMVEKPDVVGAIFGQTEGLLGDELDLRELQEKGRVGRIDVKVENKDGSSTAEIKIPSSLDSTETALLAASLETIERVGPTNADIRVREIEDQRNSKRDYIVKRAKQLLEDIQEEKPEKNAITDEVKQEVRTSEITDYRGFKAGNSAATSEEVIIVEGKADILNLLKNGIKNAVALGGTSIPSEIEKISGEKTTTAFLDGDRGGDLILKELEEKAEPDYVARAPEDKEVEELGKEEVYRELRDKEPFQYAESGEEKQEIPEENLQDFYELMDDLVATRAVHVIDEEFEVIERFPLDQTGSKLSEIDECYAVAFDGEIDNKKIQKAEKARANFIVGMEKSGNANSSKLKILSREELTRKIQ
ncbi:DNA primase [Nanohaloarchaea archaeon H01]|nr:DNA primase [Nanohaloarchaea archaeon H01]